VAYKLVLAVALTMLQLGVMLEFPTNI